MATRDHASSDAEKLDTICDYMRNELCWGISDFIKALARRKAAFAIGVYDDPEKLKPSANQVDVESILESLSIEESSLESIPLVNTDTDSDGIVDQLRIKPALLSTSRFNYFQTPSFKYKPISLEGPAFRLLRLLRGSDDLIQGQLFESKLAIPEDYTAVSYTWGGDSRPCDIMINGSIMTITKNAYLALRNLRYQEKDRIVWIDALCIDQNNKEERGQQVQHMGSIYNKAERVIIWLGEATYDTDYVMQHMKQLEEGIRHTSNNQKISDIWSGMVKSLRVEQIDLLTEGLQSLLRRDWFKRVWVIQETAQARAAEIVCGAKSVSASIFAHMPTLLAITPEPHCQPILDIMPGPLRNSSWWAEKQDLHTLLVKFCKSKATEPRDSIYALLGISSDACDTDLLKADYEKDLQDVIFDTTSFLLNFNELDSPTDRFFDWTLPKFLENLNVLANEVLQCAIDKELEALVKLLIVHNDVDVNMELCIPVPNNWLETTIKPEVEPHSYDLTLLSWAARNGHKAIVELLLEKGATLEARNFSGHTPLSLAAWSGQEATVKLLLEKGAELEAKGSSNQTPLLLAARNGHKAVVKLLVEKGAELEAKDSNNRTSLSWATGNGHKTVVKLLLEKGAELEVEDSRKQRPLSLAAENGHEAVVKLLLEKGAEPEAKDFSGRTPMLSAAENGHEAVVKLLLDKGAELEAKGSSNRTPLSWASRNGHKAVVKLLVEKGADLEAKDSNNRTPLSRATGNGHEAVVKLLLEKGAELEVEDSRKQTPLSLAAENGHEATVKLLLEKGAELEAKCSNNRTPLLLAARNRHNAVVKLLLEKGAELEAKDSSDWTPLLLAVKSGQVKVLKLLLDKGAELEAKDFYGRTPMLLAAEYGYEMTVGLLLNKGAELEAKDSNNRTPLLLAARNGHKAVVRLLVENGAELEAKDSNNRTPLSLAAENRHEKVVRLLLNTTLTTTNPPS